MKKLLAMLLCLSLILAFAGCAKTESPETTAAPVQTTAAAVETTEAASETTAEVTAMTHEEYMAAELDSEVNLVTYVQAHQSWWEDKVTVYCQSPDGAYFLYELSCSEEDAAKLVPGTKIAVTGYKGEWSGEVEIMDGTFTFLEDGDTYIAEATDVTELLGTDALIDHQNELVSIKGLSVVSIKYKNDEPGDDVYITVNKDGETYELCVEAYLTGPDTELYTTVGTLSSGDTIDVEGFLYWYNGMNPHLTHVSVVG